METLLDGAAAAPTIHDAPPAACRAPVRVPRQDGRSKWGPDKARQDPSVSTQPNESVGVFPVLIQLRDQTRLSIAAGHELSATVLRR